MRLIFLSVVLDEKNNRYKLQHATLTARQQTNVIMAKTGVPLFFYLKWLHVFVLSLELFDGAEVHLLHFIRPDFVVFLVAEQCVGLLHIMVYATE